MREEILTRNPGGLITMYTESAYHRKHITVEKMLTLSPVQNEVTKYWIAGCVELDIRIVGKTYELLRVLISDNLPTILADMQEGGEFEKIETNYGITDSEYELIDVKISDLKEFGKEPGAHLYFVVQVELEYKERNHTGITPKHSPKLSEEELEKRRTQAEQAS